jgi:esterase/lipase
MKIAYLHGLESNNIHPKNDWLRTIADVYDPLIDYRQPLIYQKIKMYIIDFKPDLIIGSSMGGFFAYNLSRELNIKSVLFNPALHSRSFTPDMTGFSGSLLFKPKTKFVLGKNDDVIEPNTTIKMMESEGYSDFIILGHGHRTPLLVFKNEILNFETSN